jgi:hypothetical protein
LEREKMTEPDRYGEELRRALTAAAELVVPAGDGLDIIRRRAARRPRVLAWLLAYVSYVPRQLTTRVRVMASELALMARGESDLLHRALARRRPQAGRPRSAQTWLRPALAAAGALLLVVAVTLAVPKLRATVINSANTGTSAHRGGGQGNNPQADGHGTQSSGASGSASRSRTSGAGPTMSTGKSRGSALFLLPGQRSPSSSSTACPTSTPPTVPPVNPDPPPTTPSGVGGLNDPGAPVTHAVTHNGSPNCTPSPTISSPTVPPTSPPPTSTPPTSPPSTSTPPTSPPPTSGAPPSSGAPAASPSDTSSGS